MRKRNYAAILCRPAKLTAPESLFAHHVVKTLRDSFTVFKYSSLHFAFFPCAASKRKPFTKGFGLTQLQQSLQYSLFGKDIMYACEQVVGKVVISFVQKSELYKLRTRRFEYTVNCVLSVRSLLAAFNQVVVVCAHTKTSLFKVFNSNFYPFPTGPTNTNNLIKGNL